MALPSSLRLEFNTSNFMLQNAVSLAIAYESARKVPGLPDPQLAVLLDLKRHGASSCETIAARCDINGKTLLRHIGFLRRGGLIDRSTQEDDFRKVVFSLSQKGREVVAPLLAALEEVQD
jgi:DNA-binding MarR family transcriptional regulator